MFPEKAEIQGFDTLWMTRAWRGILFSTDLIGMFWLLFPLFHSLGSVGGWIYFIETGKLKTYRQTSMEPCVSSGFWKAEGDLVKGAKLSLLFCFFEVVSHCSSG